MDRAGAIIEIQFRSHSGRIVSRHSRLERAMVFAFEFMDQANQLRTERDISNSIARWLASPREPRKSRSWTQVVPRRVEWLYFHVCITMKKNSVARFPGSSMVEHSAVNRRVASSNLARGAKLLLNFQMLTTTSVS
jgi:hypothetical protein